MSADLSFQRRPSLFIAVVLALVVAALNIALWWWGNRPHGPEDWHGPIGGFALEPYQRYQDPLKDKFPSDEQIDADLRLVRQYTPNIRTYSMLQTPQVPRLAEREGLKLLSGAWIDTRLDNNEREIAALIAQARRYPGTITRVLVGNETLFRNNVTPEQMMAYLDRVRAALRQPVSTAEPDYIWMKYPELAEHVDFITVHLFPYWNGIPRKDAIGAALGSYEQLQKQFPGKHIVIGEIGWPSNGDRKEYAYPSVSDEAIFLRQWFNVAKQLHLDYYVMEAFDQPWKEQLSGRTEAYWGMFNADRQPKFPFTGPVTEDTGWPWKALAASLLALLPMIWFARRFARFKLTGRFFFCALIQLACGLIVWSATLPFNFYLSWVDWTMLVLLFPAQIAILAILLINGFEFTEVLWRREWVRHAGMLRPDSPEKQPFVSIHLACYNEPPEMVIVTLDSLAELDYQNYEVLVIDNNTKDPAVWGPVKDYCEKLGKRFRFFHLEPWPGFKAGALNFGLKETAPEADVVAVIDADYVVRHDWLATLTGYFHDPKVAVVQCPQAHRDFEHNRFRRMTAWEYDGFFRIGMHHRNERNAIIQHGTMTMVRRSALEGTGGWSEWTICEDAELGLRLMHAGYELVYVDELMGKGLTPADFKAYKSQRYRWAFGAMQILKGRWSWMTQRGPLSAGQRFHFLTGWFSWFADALHLIFTLMALFWTAGMVALPQYFSLPMQLFLIPVIGFFFAKAIFGIVLYRARVPCGWYDTLMASLASMGLSHAIARGILHGLTRQKTSFVVTAKSRRMGGSSFAAFAPVREELLMAVALALCIVGMARSYGTHYIEGMLWMFILAAQSIPYVSAVVGAWIAHRAGDKSG
ncbi:MAG: benzoate transporter [Rhodanobacter sp. 68-29]|uniref:glycosyltransferase family 2 protein n=1 Tax=Rhodanobacter sp. PCA2 TaxID=2006117 RepID=UPI000869DD56|nr:glycosyltransferase family 2 protein [Rhodanobacter sp. PCA2]MBA2079261.1 benzoate transporter [Rhodanobacter sp. PCA2]MBN8922153.1 glycosyltransferase [Rhodanobacter sp.]ODU73500.1 MAG: benzoate transporter [Rhodanobacter sp. SCN 69-32]OJY55959.1 MAG: benzoate transporter [Rhodanobacter sp. 68-29]